MLNYKLSKILNIGIGQGRDESGNFNYQSKNFISLFQSYPSNNLIVYNKNLNSYQLYSYPFSSSDLKGVTCDDNGNFCVYLPGYKQIGYGGAGGWKVFGNGSNYLTYCIAFGGFFWFVLSNPNVIGEYYLVKSSFGDNPYPISPYVPAGIKLPSFGNGYSPNYVYFNAGNIILLYETPSQLKILCSITYGGSINYVIALPNVTSFSWRNNYLYCVGGYSNPIQIINLDSGINYTTSRIFSGAASSGPPVNVTKNFMLNYYEAFSQFKFASCFENFGNLNPVAVPSVVVSPNYSKFISSSDTDDFYIALADGLYIMTVSESVIPNVNLNGGSAVTDFSNATIHGKMNNYHRPISLSGKFKS